MKLFTAGKQQKAIYGLLILATTYSLALAGHIWGVEEPQKTSLPKVQTRQEAYLPDPPAGIIGKSSQVLLVRNMGPVAVDVLVLALQVDHGRWQSPFGPMAGVIGVNGFAAPGEKREGDGRTPSGIFPLGTVFGYEHSLATRMPYRQATADDLWVDDVLADDYNRWVTRGKTQATSFENMKRSDDLYKYGIVVEYNTRPVIKGHGSAIFFHLWKGKGIPTAGCVALPEEDLLRIIRWLDPIASPLAVMGQTAMRGY